MEKIALFKIFEYDKELIKQEIEKYIKIINDEKFPFTKSKILLKPNFLSAKPKETAVTTNPEFIKAVAELFQDYGNKIEIADSPGIDKVSKIVKILELEDYFQEKNINYYEFKESKKVELIKNSKNLFKQLEIAGELEKYDHIINLPKVKTHGMMTLTLAVKNLFGCIVGFRKGKWHFKAGKNKDFFARLLIEIYEQINPSLNIVDGIIGMEGNGPGNGTPRNLNFIILGKNGFIIDYIISKILGVDYHNVPVLKNYVKNREKNFNFEDYILYGDKISDFEIKNFKLPNKLKLNFGLPNIFTKMIENYLLEFPFIDQVKCKKCLICKKCCPMNAIDIKSNKLEVNYKNCIRCFCCQEMCPYGAIKIENTLLTKIFNKILK